MNKTWVLRLIPRFFFIEGPGSEVESAEEFLFGASQDPFVCPGGRSSSLLSGSPRKISGVMTLFLFFKYMLSMSVTMAW